MDQREQVEIWKDVKGYEDYYQVSNLGRVKSLDRMIDNGKGKYKKTGRILKQSNTTTGYKKVELSVNAHKKSKKVHRLVLESFNEVHLKKRNICNHIDNNPHNNNINNLEWCTQKENIEHAYKIGAIPTLNFEKKILEEMYINKKISLNDIAKKLNSNETTIKRYLKLYGVKMRSISEARSLKYGIKAKEVKEMLKTKTQLEIANEYGCNPTTISHAIKRFKKNGEWLK